MAYLPTAVVISVLWAIFSFELTPLKYVNPIFGLVLGSPIIYVRAALAGDKSGLLDE